MRIRDRYSPRQSKQAQAPSDEKTTLQREYMMAIRKSDKERHAAEDLTRSWREEEMARSRGEETPSLRHISEPTRLLSISNAVICLH